MMTLEMSATLRRLSVPSRFRRGRSRPTVEALLEEIAGLTTERQSLRDQGVNVPLDLSVAGFDDIATLRDLNPALTTVRLPLTRMGEQALELALGDSATGEVENVAGEVILRASTREI